MSCPDTNKCFIQLTDHKPDDQSITAAAGMMVMWVVGSGGGQSVCVLLFVDCTDHTALAVCLLMNEVMGSVSVL